ncbi:unnamed protein product [Pleuronectes platessa]|uniref:Uncharacterized protein n=1 Tax=Pleuronectes platessa TaxID=8262 RepID=A0A9N7VPC3_PLEPL|nr:unnamed protein product [Pleuronectes platessa]
MRRASWMCWQRANQQLYGFPFMSGWTCSDDRVAVRVYQLKVSQLYGGVRCSFAHQSPSMLSSPSPPQSRCVTEDHRWSVNPLNPGKRGEGVPEVRGRVAEGSRSHGGQMDSGDGQADGGSRPERPGSSILYQLKFMEEFVWETKEKGIAVIQAGSDKGVNQDCGGVGSE